MVSEGHFLSRNSITLCIHKIGSETYRFFGKNDFAKYDEDLEDIFI